MLDWKPACKPLVHATDDVAAAYRQLRCAHPEYTVVGMWDTIESGVARNWFGVCSAAYFDDVDTTGPVYCGATGKKVLHDLAAAAGTPFASSKDTGPSRRRGPFSACSSTSQTT